MFNGLTPAQSERLFLLVEECGEVIQAAGKVLRHGNMQWHPKEGVRNVTHLENEIGDLLGIIDQMVKVMDVGAAEIAESRKTKWSRALQYAHHQKEK